MSLYNPANLLQKEPVAISAAIIAILNVFQLTGVVSLDGNTVSALNIALVAVLGLFSRQNVYNPVTTQKIANRAAATGNTDIGEPPSGKPDSPFRPE